MYFEVFDRTINLMSIPLFDYFPIPNKNTTIFRKTQFFIKDDSFFKNKFFSSTLDLGSTLLNVAIDFYFLKCAITRPFLVFLLSGTKTKRQFFPSSLQILAC